MALIRQHDRRSGITYVYESRSWWDPERKMSRSKRTLIGRLDPETGEVVPTDGRMRRAAERRAEEAKAEANVGAQAVAGVEERLAELERRLAELEATLAERGRRR